MVVSLLKIVMKTNMETKKRRHTNQCVSSVNEKILEYKGSGLEIL